MGERNVKPFWKTIERIFVAVGLGFVAFVGLETLRAYQTLAELHPWAGYAFLVLLAVLLGYILWQIRLVFVYRSVPHPPAKQSSDSSSIPRNEWIRYLDKIAERFEKNPLLNKKEAQIQDFRNDILKLNSLKSDLVFEDALGTIEEQRIAPLIQYLDEKAEAIVSDNVGIVTIGTALSPYRSVDFYIVLARNLRMVNSILRVYRTRPLPRETIAVFYDIARVVAAVNILNAMDTVWAGLGRHVPFVGRYGEAISEGLFSGLLTSVAGHAAIDRCRSYRHWSREEAARKYRGRLTRYGNDVWGIIMRHGVEKLRPKNFRNHEEETNRNSKDSKGFPFFRKKKKTEENDTSSV